MKGRVLKSTGSWCEVLTEQGERFACRARGKLRLEGYGETNPVAVGDFVEFNRADLTIEEIHPRINHMLRQSVKKTGQMHVLAANIDQVMLIATLRQPRTSLGFIDRFLVTAEAFRIPQVLVFNKTDLMSTEERQQVQQLIDLYTTLDVHGVAISALDDDPKEIRELLSGKVTLVAGHSGVGKSTLLNKLSAEINQKIGEISGFSAKGVHTTTFAEMFQVDADTFIIDTPGVKEWGLAEMTPEEISDYFPEMRERRLGCKFGPRCLHLQEPKCAILDAVRSGDIAPSRYHSYVSMVMGEDNRK